MLCALALLILPACEVLYFVGGKGKAKAAFTLPKTARVLVFVDPHPTSQTPIDVPATLGERLNEHLYRYKATDNLVAQTRVTALRRDEDFAKMGLADLAQKTDAAVVVYVNVLRFKAGETSGGALLEGYAQTLIKVVDRQGTRLFPDDTGMMGIGAEARVPPRMAEQTSVAAIQKQLIEDLTVRIGRMFHEYDLEDRELIR